MKNAWIRCDGKGRPGRPAEIPRRSSATALSRRSLLAGGALGAVAWAAGSTALADVTIRPGRGQPDGDILVSIFLRGGADGLNIVPPYAEDGYHAARPSLRIHSPTDSSVSPAERALDLDGFFGFHPALAPLVPLYQANRLAVVHACGSGDQTRSHFEAMAAMERGLATDAGGTASGWIARHLSSTQERSSSPLRAVAFGSVMPDLLRGSTQAIAIQSLADFRLNLPEGTPGEKMREALEELYAPGRDEIARAGRETLDVLDALNRMDPKAYRPAGGAQYPDSQLGVGLKQVACLIKGDVGLEVACLDMGSWDTHVAQGATTGWMPSYLADLASSIAAFAQDLQAEMGRITLLVLTEFGRRLKENQGLGTDHGRAGVMLLLGGGIAGGKVYGRWPGLSRDKLEEGLDLRVTTDYRAVLAEVVSARLKNPALDAVFPGFTASPQGIARP